MGQMNALLSPASNVSSDLDTPVDRGWPDEERKRISEQLNKRLDPRMRPSQQDLELRNVVPPNVFTDEVMMYLFTYTHYYYYYYYYYYYFLELQKKMSNLKTKVGFSGKPYQSTSSGQFNSEMADLLKYKEWYDTHVVLPSNEERKNDNSNNNTLLHINVNESKYDADHSENEDGRGGSNGNNNGNATPSNRQKKKNIAKERPKREVEASTDWNGSWHNEALSERWLHPYDVAEKEKKSHFLTVEEKLKHKLELKTQPTPLELYQRGVLVEPSLSDPVCSLLLFVFVVI
ncbi:hypothetical protein RFI_27248 [Reticulomyxa filosa]|uniref:Uncharacterized protein n=1 Tax=Reticulomyxa filosa TaxID=46433 RepID=X6MAR5_RETFI|nr:hypothetical protein RFI_27248 [Reticulomyxa filosa]|eukprot:ETO10130.1 hypothetical protein RFI_27248 [Reticulomyxa filosa]